MSYYKNLVPGQWQIGDIVMGTGTNIKVESVEVAPDDINAQDYQVASTDEVRFGRDNFKPTTIQFKLNILNNRLMPDWEDYIPNFWHSQPTINDLKNEWRFDSGRRSWGEMKHMYVCSKLDEIPKVIFGRPGQFTYKFDDGYKKGEVINILAEYRRADTLAYSAVEFVTDVPLGDVPKTIVRSGGDCDTWLRILGQGPITNPVITIGTQQIKINAEFEEGEIFELSSYPWQRRVVDGERNNLAASLTGDKYLDKVILPAKTFTYVRWTSDELGTFIPDISNTSWQQDIDDLKQKTLPSTFTTLLGKLYIRFDLFNPDFASHFLGGASIFGHRSACIYNKSQFKTRNQRSTATIVQPQLNGRAGIVIMSTPTMTNYVILEVTSGSGDNWLKIRTGTSPSAYSSVRASWQNLAFGGWKETDFVSISSEYDAGTGDTTYRAYFNDVEKCNWVDSSNVVSTESTNRSQGYIFNMENDTFATGVGFKDLISYDHAVVPEPTGKLLFLWRDAYSVI